MCVKTLYYILKTRNLRHRNYTLDENQVSGVLRGSCIRCACERLHRRVESHFAVEAN